MTHLIPYLRIVLLCFWIFVQALDQESLFPIQSIENATRWRCTDLAEVAGHSDIMPDVVIELSAGWFHKGLEGTGAQVDDQPQSSIPQRQVDVISRFPRMKQQAVPLQRAEGQRDLIQAALDGGLRKVVAEVLVAFKGGHRLPLA